VGVKAWWGISREAVGPIKRNGNGGSTGEIIGKCPIMSGGKGLMGGGAYRGEIKNGGGGQGGKNETGQGTGWPREKLFAHNLL